MNVRIFAITKPGLLAMTLAVASLWACFGLEAASVRQSNRDTLASLQTLARLKRATGTPAIPSPARHRLPFSRAPRTSVS